MVGRRFEFDGVRCSGVEVPVVLGLGLGLFCAAGRGLPERDRGGRREAPLPLTELPPLLLLLLFGGEGRFATCWSGTEEELAADGLADGSTTGGGLLLLLCLFRFFVPLPCPLLLPFTGMGIETPFPTTSRGEPDSGELPEDPEAEECTFLLPESTIVAGIASNFPSLLSQPATPLHSCDQAQPDGIRVRGRKSLQQGTISLSIKTPLQR